MKAIRRLPPKEAYDRVFRIRRAFQVCLFDDKIERWEFRGQFVLIVYFFG